MSIARATKDYLGGVAAAEQLWYDTERWPAFIDGCAHVVRVEGPWPHPGALVEWRSTPAGRGRVLERVESYQPGAGQTLSVRDEQTTALQRVSFEQLDGGVALELELDYQLTGAALVRPLLDALFVRRAWSASLQRTLERFGHELG